MQSVYPSRNLLCRDFLTLGFYLLIFGSVELFSINLLNCSRSCAVSQLNRIKTKFSACLHKLSNSSNFTNIMITKNCRTTARREEHFEGKCFQELQKMQMRHCSQVYCLPTRYHYTNYLTDVTSLYKERESIVHHGRHNPTSLSVL